MTRTTYPALPTGRVASEGCFLTSSHVPMPVRIDSPALQVMTDLTRLPAAIICRSAFVHEAHQAMIHRGVRMLFVTNEDRQLEGIITASDLLGERAMQAMNRYELTCEELRVEHIMTAADALETIELAMVTRAEVGHVIATLQACGRQHTFVVDRNVAGRQIICGVFSATQIARQLGAPVHAGEIARTFAEIEAVIAVS